MKIREAVRRFLNLPRAEQAKDRTAVVSPETYDILMRANEQGERLRKMEAPHVARTGNPFGDILEQRVEKSVRHV